MKRCFLVIGLMATLQPIFAQLPEDALRMSWNIPSGTARQQAIGGAMSSLGGEISSVFVNPAGLGLYKTGELVLSPGLSLLNNKGSFLGSTTKADSEAKFNLGTSGVVWSNSNRYSRWTSSAFSIAVNRTANFNNNIRYSGLNDYSSFSENMANEFYGFYEDSRNRFPNRSDQQIVDDALNSLDVSLLTKMGLYTYLVDIDSSSGLPTVISRAELAGDLNQDNSIRTSGGITELAFGFAGNMDDKFYIGGSIGVPIVNYGRVTEYTETDANGTGNNEFTSAKYTEDYTSKGLGINAKLGFILKPASQVRLGLTVHTPTLYGLTDRFNSKLTTDLDLGQDVFSVNATDVNNNNVPEFKYDLRTPWRFIVGGSYVISEAADVRNQKGFITADVEYLNYGGNRFAAGNTGQSNDEFKGMNDIVKEIYKGAFNFRVGGELKFNTLMTRLGFAWYGSPYDDDQLKARKMNVSGGLGYRNKGFFVDLAYVHSLHRDVHFPYRLEAPRLNVYSDLREGTGNLLLTFGVKF